MMRRLIRGILVALAVSSSVALSGFAQPPRTMSVQVREAQLRSAPSFLAEIVAKPAYGDRVEIIEDKGPWKRGSHRGVQGWIHASALTTKRIALKAGAADVQTTATGGEIALAGKGFSEEVEKQYKTQNRNLDYTWVDRMEAFRVAPQRMQAFLKEGYLVPAEGVLR
ncbi:MAG: SH3 domain-containing protein [Thermodesulfobacteriota bacterium]